MKVKVLENLRFAEVGGRAWRFPHEQAPADVRSRGVSASGLPTLAEPQTLSLPPQPVTPGPVPVGRPARSTLPPATPLSV